MNSDVDLTVSIGVYKDVFREITGMVSLWIFPTMLLHVWIEVCSCRSEIWCVTHRILMDVNCVLATGKRLHFKVNIQATFHGFSKDDPPYVAISVSKWHFQRNRYLLTEASRYEQNANHRKNAPHHFGNHSS